MKNLMLLLMVVVVSVLSGCAASQYTATGSCVEGDSIILSVTNNNPTALDKALLAVSLAALERDVYTAKQADAVLTEIKGVLTDGISYADFKDYLDQKVLAVAFLILGDEIGAIAEQGESAVISDCDRELILAHIEHQRALVVLYL